MVIKRTRKQTSIFILPRKRVLRTLVHLRGTQRLLIAWKTSTGAERKDDEDERLIFETSREYERFESNDSGDSNGAASTILPFGRIELKV